ncbi:hypothetical protein MPTK1_6g00570 [Marchantia polymorpha subsp. ruderalis]|uniref:Uncharacterized protein n=2 Tax=Marchantia polymorpha TaxID=3197 RepID=A0AAF6BM41_MARPO|nr:hypothetical protein MARPO_0104s0009 [Marchantia polymorpha]BBN13075.1 hypothetical protein Mp_6g00570 [Marchantia polymorpha subsp. ruderalis]|eukprot:PTQ31970.1 hypothetical protein MARPO_0104s0009 [Marchantia polymorpha]
MVAGRSQEGGAHGRQATGCSACSQIGRRVLPVPQQDKQRRRNGSRGGRGRREGGKGGRETKGRGARSRGQKSRGRGREGRRRRRTDERPTEVEERRGGDHELKGSRLGAEWSERGGACLSSLVGAGGARMWGRRARGSAMGVDGMGDGEGHGPRSAWKE